MTNSAINLGITVNTDGYSLAGGTTSRSLTVSGGNVALAGSGANTYTFPASTDTLVGLAATQTLTNKTVTGLILAANTATVPALTFGAGTTLSSPSNGYLWYDGTGLYFRGSTTTTNLLASGSSSGVTTVTLASTTQAFSTAGKNYVLTATFSGTGTFSDIGFQAILTSSDTGLMISPNFNTQTTGIASWVIYVPTNLPSAAYGSQTFATTLFGRGWSSGTTTGVVATWSLAILA